MNKIKAKKILDRLETIEDKAMSGIDVFESEISNLTNRMKNEVSVKTLESVNLELNRFRKAVDLTPVLSAFQLVRGDFDSKFQDFSSDVEMKVQSLIDRIEKGFRKLDDIDHRTTSLNQKMDDSSMKSTEDEKSIDSLSKSQDQIKENLTRIDSNIQPLKRNLESGISQIKKEVLSEIAQIKKDVSDMLEKAKSDLSERISNINPHRGGAMNRDLRIDGTNYLTRYTDINFITSGWTAVNNDTTKRVDITVTGGGGGFTYANETPGGTINGDGQGSGNVTFTLAHTPTNPTGALLYGSGGFASSWLYIYGVDYTISGDTITFTTAPLSGTILRIFYA